MAKIGELVAYRERNNFLLGIVVDRKGDKLVLLSENNKKSNMLLDKLEVSLNKVISVDRKDFEIAREVKSIRDNLENESKSVSIKELYELLCEEEEGFTPLYMAELYFDNHSSNENIVIMIIALSNDSTYFKLKHGRFYPNTYKAVSAKIEERDRYERSLKKKQQNMDIVIRWLKDFISGNNDKLEIPLEVIRYIEPLKQYVLFRDLYDKKDVALDILETMKKHCGFKMSKTVIESLYILFQQLGIFKEDENLSILKYNIPTTFGEKALEEAKQIKGFLEKDIGDRLDLRHLHTITIDDKYTKDIDDAISFEIKDDKYIVWVHITDVSHFIDAGSALDSEALHRGLTVYLPLEKISMFPESLSDYKFSLIEGELRPCTSFMINFDHSFNMVDYNIVQSVVVVNKNMTYKEVHELIDSDKPLELLYRVANALRLKRESDGAIEFNNPDIKIRVLRDKRIELDIDKHNFKSDLIVKELMIFINHLSAVFCYLNGISSIYICQEPPDKDIVLVDNDKANLFDQLKKMKKSEIDFIPRKHFALGLYVYTQISSPIRRYHDLIIHRQLKSFLSSKNKPYYSKQDIQIVAATADKASKEIKAIERDTSRYWLLKYLKQEKGRSFEAIVLRKANNGYLVEIQEVFLQTILNTTAYFKLNQRVTVLIDRVNPILDTIFIKLSKTK